MRLAVARSCFRGLPLELSPIARMPTISVFWGGRGLSHAIFGVRKEMREVAATRDHFSFEKYSQLVRRLTDTAIGRGGSA